MQNKTPQNNLEGFPPRVFIIGAQKSGTTSLASLLDQHPRICLSNPKEPNYYSVNYDKNGSREQYKSGFHEIDKILVDASTTYTMRPLTSTSLTYKPGRASLTDVAVRIYKDSPGAKLIYIVREPVSRMYSNYWHNVKYGYEKLAFLDAIEKDPLYYEMSLYYSQLEGYLDFFHRDNILVIKFEDMMTDQMASFHTCARFIGIDASSTQPQYKNENKGKQYNAVGHLLVNSRLLRNFEKVVPQKLSNYLKKVISKEIPPLEEDIKKKLARHFIDDQKNLLDKFGIHYPDSSHRNRNINSTTPR